MNIRANHHIFPGIVLQLLLERLMATIPICTDCLTFFNLIVKTE